MRIRLFLLGAILLCIATIAPSASSIESDALRIPVEVRGRHYQISESVFESLLAEDLDADGHMDLIEMNGWFFYHDINGVNSTAIGEGRIKPSSASLLYGAKYNGNFEDRLQSWPIILALKENDIAGVPAGTRPTDEIEIESNVVERFDGNVRKFQSLIGEDEVPATVVCSSSGITYPSPCKFTFRKDGFLVSISLMPNEFSNPEKLNSSIEKVVERVEWYLGFEKFKGESRTYLWIALDPYQSGGKKRDAIGVALNNVRGIQLSTKDGITSNVRLSPQSKRLISKNLQYIYKNGEGTANDGELSEAFQDRWDDRSLEEFGISLSPFQSNEYEIGAEISGLTKLNRTSGVATLPDTIYRIRNGKGIAVCGGRLPEGVCASTVIRGKKAIAISFKETDIDQLSDFREQIAMELAELRSDIVIYPEIGRRD